MATNVHKNIIQHYCVVLRYNIYLAEHNITLQKCMKYILNSVLRPANKRFQILIFHNQ